MVKNKLLPDAKVAIIYATPSVEDEARKKHLQEVPAQKYITYLGENDIYFTCCSILTVVQDRHTRVEKISGDELTCWKELLRRDLQKINPTLIITIGELPFHILTDFVKHDKYRGSVLQLDPKWKAPKIMPMLDFTYYYSQPSWHPLTAWDCAKAKKHSETTDLMRNNANIIVTKDLEFIASKFLSDEYLADPDSLLSFDIEASGTDMTCIGFAKDTSEAIVIPLVHMAHSEFCASLRLIDQILRSPVKKIAQNGQFDIFYLAYYYNVKVVNYWWDTMLCMHSLFSNIPKGLDTISSIFTNEPYWKDEGKQWKLAYSKVNWPQFFKYNGKDVINTLESAINQAPMLEARGTQSTFQQEMDLVYPVVTMEYKGMLIKQSLKQKFVTENAELIRKWELFLHTLVGFNLNINSPKQLKQYLFEDLKLPNRVRKGKLTTDEDALLSLIPYNPVVIKPIMILRTIKKEKTFYNIKTDRDNRVRTTLKPAGTETGRLASSKSIVGTGFNLQTIPKKIREMFIADPDYIIVQADYSKAESWIVAFLAKDDKMIKALFGEDFHSENASNFLGKKVTKADYDDRQIGKKVSHAANYGVGAFLMQKSFLKEGYTFTKTQCQKMLDDYFKAYPKVEQNYHKWIQNQLGEDRTLVNIFGRKITYYDFWGKDLFKKAYAYIPQGTVGDMTNKALINVYNNLADIRQSGIRLDLLLQVHDSLVMQVHKDDLTQEVIDAIQSNMTIEMKIRGKTITVPVDIECGYDWYNLTEWDEFKEELVA